MTNNTSKGSIRLQSKPRSWAARQSLEEAISGRVDFTTSGSLSGESVRGYLPGTGRLVGADLDIARADDGNVDYVVMSYATPIAWHRITGAWHVVEQSFSVTTSQQQNIVRVALDRDAR